MKALVIAKLQLLARPVKEAEEKAAEAKKAYQEAIMRGAKASERCELLGDQQRTAAMVTVVKGDFRWVYNLAVEALGQRVRLPKIKSFI